MKSPREIKIQEYNYPLPDERIAKFPMAQRDSSKLLVYNKGAVSHDTFRNVASYLPEHSLLVCNNTRVIQARLHFRKSTGALIEVFLLEPYQPCDYERIFQSRGECSWVCMIGNLKKWRNGTPLSSPLLTPHSSLILSATLGAEEATGHVVTFRWDSDEVTFADILDAAGELPIPPYLNRATEESDKQTYQTVYSKIKGSVAAPTAGLHFTPDVLATIDARGIEREELTLHVGAGTFKPVKAERIEDHAMHREYIAVRRHIIERLIAHDAAVTAVGTTTVRTLESLYYLGCRISRDPNLPEEALHVEQWEPYDTPSTLSSIDALRAILTWMDANGINILHATTSIIIAPGYQYHIVRRLITNFHQPQSTLLLLVSALVGDRWREIYDYALANDFRFLSYGDSSLLIP